MTYFCIFINLKSLRNENYLNSKKYYLNFKKSKPILNNHFEIPIYLIILVEISSLIEFYFKILFSFYLESNFNFEQTLYYLPIYKYLNNSAIYYLYISFLFLYIIYFFLIKINFYFLILFKNQFFLQNYYNLK
jgi:hypothetical protein